MALVAEDHGWLLLTLLVLLLLVLHCGGNDGMLGYVDGI